MNTGAGNKNFIKEVDGANPRSCQIESFGIGSFSFYGIK
jgi:hypothetical protein